MRRASVVLAVIAGIGGGAPAARTQPGPGRAELCVAVDRPSAEVASVLAPLGEPGREALVRLTASSEAADVACGVAGLAALRDPRGVAPLAAALANPAFRADAYRFARWATFAASGPDPALAPSFLPLLAPLADPAVWAAVAEDGARLLGAIDAEASRERLVAELARPQADAMLDALIQAAGRQGDARPRSRVVAWGDEAVAARSGNLTYEQASRVGAVASYLLALAPDAFADGLRLLRQLGPRDQQQSAAWAVQTWCERSVRRPADRQASSRARQDLIDALDGAAVQWSGTATGAFACPAAP
jgi:hypothetical protein